jgi:hypothetical protein
LKAQTEQGAGIRHHQSMSDGCNYNEHKEKPLVGLKSPKPLPIGQGECWQKTNDKQIVWYRQWL